MVWGSGTFEIAGHTLEYACFGPPPEQSATIVMLHEGLGSVGLWRDWPQKVSEATGLGVLVYSRAGYGRSSSVPLPRPLDYMTREAEDVLGSVMDAAGVRSAVLLGHSDGATISAIYAGSVSDMRVRGLILIAPHFFTEAAGLAAIAEAGNAYADGDLRARLARHHDDPDAAFHGWYGAWTDPGFADWNVADAIDHWRVPVLAIQGDADPYGTRAQIDEIADRIYAPLEILWLQEAGHAPHQDHEGTVTAALADFCATLARLEGEVSPVSE
ncbi:alpha/beta fold hydrolase [Tateyamaria sp. SN6-1]|uniref:alpha/beta fold hydrolase n=1 Tax=Tateyamaria sp. SN6-1 TaxID=3092148 RepID=UPI0039F50CF8